MHGFINHTSPNDLMVQLKDGIGASNCHAEHINVVMPLLYAGRQHRRNTRENLACGAFLREIDNLPRIKSLITFDAHDQGVEHATQYMEFENFYATNTILEKFIVNTPKKQLKNLVFVAPDNGATGRRNVYLNSFNSKYINREAGSFIKQRDYNRFENGKYPVTSHDYCGSDNIEGKTAIVVDDMISSGGSMFDVIDELHKRKIAHIYIIVTFALFTNGIDRFKEYYDKKILDGIYTTNLSYIPDEYKKEKWLYICDCSKELSEIIYDIHNDLSITSLLTDKSKPIKLLEDKFGKGEKNE
jgi:ribose-phosphate pyrophosphokinase